MSAVRPRTFMIEHVSDFQYAEPAHGSWMVLRLRPREDQGQHVLRFDLHIDPLASATPFEDSFGNACHLFNVHREHRHACVHAKTQVETAEAPRLVDHMTKDGWDTLAERVDLVHSWEFLKPSRFARASPTLDDFAAAHGIGRGATPLSTLLETASTLHRTFRYEPGATKVDSPIERILETHQGVCQDYTHVMIALARSWGIPSRYISGYLHFEGVAGEQTVIGASHAWAEFLLPDIGWLGIDPTNDTLADHRHIRVAVGRDYADAAPTRGAVFGGGEVALEVRVSVVDGEEPVPVGKPHAGRANLSNVASSPPAPQTGTNQ